MKKKFWLILLAIVATMCLCFGLSACSFFGTIGSVDQSEQQGGSQGGEQQGGSQGGGQQGGSQGGGQQGGGQGGGQQGGSQGGGSGTTPSHTEEWAKNESGHWHVVAGEKEGFAAHTYKDGKCTECNYEHTGHTFEYSEKTETGHTGTCSVCGKTVTGQHRYENGKCTKCNYEHEAHIYGVYVGTESGHSQNCTICGKVLTVTEQHNYENGKCTTCDYEHASHAFVYSEKTETEHTGACPVCGKTVTEAHNYENGKCTACEYEHSGHTYGSYRKTESEHLQTCSVCGKTVTGQHNYENGKCTECNYVHKSHTHVYSEKTETKHTGTCTVCGKTVTEKHTYENGVCEDCAYEHQNHDYGACEKTETEHTGACSVCGKTVTGQHTYEKGICTECSYIHQNHNYGTDNICPFCGAKKSYTESADGTKIYFGEYPQTEVTDENDSDKSLRNSLNMAAGSVPSAGSPGKWTDYGYYRSYAVSEYMWYIDMEYQGSRYRGVYFTQYRQWDTGRGSGSWGSPTDYSYQDDNGYNINTAYWFKYEPIEWRILKRKDGKAFLMANIILDSQQYYFHTLILAGKPSDPNNYQDSDIRAWLNGTFYETAFDEYAQVFIETTEVDNSAASTGSSKNPYACHNTQDKVFLLSLQEVLNTSYGFSSDRTTDTARQLKSTDYAKSQGCCQRTYGSGYEGNCQWRLRSPRYYNYGSREDDRLRAYSVVGDGGFTGSFVYDTSDGIVPALWIKL